MRKLLFPGFPSVLLLIGCMSTGVVLAKVAHDIAKRQPQLALYCLKSIQITNDLSLEKRDLYKATDEVIRGLIPELRDNKQIPSREHKYAPVWDYLYMQQIKCRQKARAKADLPTPDAWIERALQEVGVRYAVFENLPLLEIPADSEKIPAIIYR